jgi:Domain of unknown function (DUF3127)
MEIKGKVVQIMPLQTGEGKNGPWKKQDFVIETDGQYPKKVCISAWGDKMNTSLIQMNSDINVSFDVESREYNSKWYTDLRAWKIEAASAADGAVAVPSYSAPAAVPTFTAPAPEMAGGDDLPF